MPYVWRIGKALMRRLVNANRQGGYYYFTGASPWGGVHAPW